MISRLVRNYRNGLSMIIAARYPATPRRSSAVALTLLPEAGPPEADRLMAHLYTRFAKQHFGVPARQRKPEAEPTARRIISGDVLNDF